MPNSFMAHHQHQAAAGGERGQRLGQDHLPTMRGRAGRPSEEATSSCAVSSCEKAASSGRITKGVK